MGPTRQITFTLKDFESFGGFENMSKGELMRFAVNPYNGKVVVMFQDRQKNACEVIEAVINQITKDLRHLRMQEGADKTIRDYADYMDGTSEVELKPLAKKSVNRDKGAKARRKAS